MIVCQITSMHDWDDDRIYQRACVGLARHGMEVHLIATKPQKLPLAFDGVSCHWIKVRKGIKRRWFSSKEAIEKAIAIKADIYHFHDPDLLPHVLKLKNKSPTSKVIYDIHENYIARFEQWSYTKHFSKVLKKLFRNYELNIIKKIDGYTVTTESMHNLFQETGKPWLEIRNTVDTSRLNNINLEQNKFEFPTIYTSGTNSDARNVIETVKAFPKILKAFPNARMMFVGRYFDDLEDRIEKYCKEVNISEKVELGGMLPWADNFERTVRAFCGCVFYEDNLNNKVTLPNRLFEYMYCGIPVIGTNFKEVQQVIDDAKCGITVDSSDPKEIAEVIIYLLKNPKIAKEMGANGKRAIEKTYGYHIDLKNMINFYSLLKQ